MKQSLFSVVLIALVTALPLNATAQHRPHHSDPHPGYHESHHPAHAHAPHRQAPMPPCATDEQMAVVMKTLKNQSMDEKKLEIAKLCVVLGHFCTDDLARMAKGFSFDDNRLEFLLYAHRYCSDPERYPTLREVFSFSSNFDKLLDAVYPAK